jgi:hypothetical protein
MVRSTGSQPRIRVKVRGSKWHAAEAEDWRDREAFRRDREGGKGVGQWRGNGEAGVGWGGDHPSQDPAHADQGLARAQ